MSVLEISGIIMSRVRLMALFLGFPKIWSLTSSNFIGSDALTVLLKQICVFS